MTSGDGKLAPSRSRWERFKAWAGIGERRWTKSPGEEVQPAKTLWDWLQLLVVPVILIAVTFAWSAMQTRSDNKREDRRLAADRATAKEALEDTTLQGYLDEMSTLMLDENLRDSKESDPVRVVAVIETLTTLHRLHGARKGRVVRFLHEADLLRPEVEDLVVGKISLDGADLTGANLRDAHLSKAALSGAYLMDANLSGADLHVARLWNAHLRDANLERVFAENVDLRNAHLNDANLAGAILNKGCLSGSELAGADLRHARLDEADLSYANLQSANLQGANLQGANLSYADLKGADLKGANLQGAILGKGEAQASRGPLASLSDSRMFC